MLSNALYNAANALYGTFGAGKRLDEKSGAVLIIGGSSDGLGIELCSTLAIDDKVYVINIDSRDMELILNFKDAAVVAKYYRFIPCRDLSNADLVLEALNQVKNLKLPITLFINNVQVGFRTIYSNNFSIGYRGIPRLQQFASANVTNIMIATKFFLNEIVPQTEKSTHGNVNFYIVNLTTVLTLDAPEYGMEYVSSKAALNQFHDGLTSELAVKSTRKRIKTLLIYLPHAPNGHAWEMMSTDLCEQVVECLKMGRRGCAMLRAEDETASGDLHGKIRNGYRYRAGGLKSKWTT